MSAMSKFKQRGANKLTRTYVDKDDDKVLK